MRTILATAVALAFSTVAFAQMEGGMPKPGPEVKRLSYYVGTWKSEGEIKTNDFGWPAGKFSSTDKSEMLAGGFFLIMHSTGTSTMGPMTSIAMMGYDPKAKVYTYDAFDNMGMHETAKGSVEGDTWTFTSEDEMGGKMVKGRYIMKESSATQYTFKYDYQAADGSWKTMMEGKSTKSK